MIIASYQSAEHFRRRLHAIEPQSERRDELIDAMRSTDAESREPWVKGVTGLLRQLVEYVDLRSLGGEGCGLVDETRACNLLAAPGECA